jgi:hypothetical protein
MSMLSTNPMTYCWNQARRKARILALQGWQIRKSMPFFSASGTESEQVCKDQTCQQFPLPQFSLVNKVPD